MSHLWRFRAACDSHGGLQPLRRPQCGPGVACAGLPAGPRFTGVPPARKTRMQRGLWSVTQYIHFFGVPSVSLPSSLCSVVTQAVPSTGPWGQTLLSQGRVVEVRGKLDRELSGRGSD